MGFRITVDVGGTFTDVVLTDERATVSVGKASTTPARAFDGIRGALEVIGAERGTTVEELLAGAELFVYSTTRATNAIVEHKTATTALLVTAGFPDVLVLREGGKTGAFDYSRPYPEPYVPRRLTFEVPERIDAQGDVVTPLDETTTRAVVGRLARAGVEAVAVCLLWSIVNPAHELRVGELLAEELPDVAVTLSHQLSPTIREYRRASTTAIDASLKPLLGGHLRQVADDLKATGFRGELLAATSFGGVMHLEDLAARPVYATKSGPALAPVAGRVYGESELGARDVIVCDMGGTSFDVSLIRDGAVNFTRATWLGGEFTGHVIATSSVDVRSIGAGGGSIAWIDDGGLLRVGPRSAGAEPGPACYGRGGAEPTVTDAALVLGYLDPERFLGGRMSLDVDAATSVVGELAMQLGLAAEEAASAILTVANEHMVAAIAEITVNEGVDPRESLVIAGGGAAGLTIASIASEFGCRQVLIPRTAGALSAMGGQFSDVIAEFTATAPTDTAHFDYAGIERVVRELERDAGDFAERVQRRGIATTRTETWVQARYAYQVWDLDLLVPFPRIAGPDDVSALARAFDELHERIFAVAEPGQTIELLSWKVRVIGTLPGTAELNVVHANGSGVATRPRQRRAFFTGRGWVDIPVHDGPGLAPECVLDGPAVITEPSSTLLIPPDGRARVTAHGNYVLELAS